MRLIASIDASDIQEAQSIVERMKNHPFVQDRISRNIQTAPLAISTSEMWQTLLMCLLTTQNKSGLGSPVNTFLRKEPFPLALEVCRFSVSPGALIEGVLSKLGIRRWIISSGFAAENLNVLESGGWKDLETWLERLLNLRAFAFSYDQYQIEREAAQEVQNLLRGLGPKQSRNFWQELGLFRNEIPLDSRIIKWCNHSLGYYIPVSGLSDEKYYCQVMDMIRELCSRADLAPCVLDAAIFASFEKGIL